MKRKTICVLATLDTKGQEAEYVKEHIRKRGHRVLIVDAGVLGKPAAKPDVTREQVAEAGGTTLSTLLVNPSRETAAPVMEKGAERIIAGLVEAGDIQGLLAMGGTQGTTLCSRVMRALPYGFPKVMVSTMASGDCAPWVDIKDVTMMFSVADIMGLNPVTRTILANAAGAVCGMAESAGQIEKADHPLVAVTTVGITTQGAMKAKAVLEEAGYETIVFHAIGPGGRAMEQMMRDGIIGAVLDYSTIEVSNHMFDALLNGGKERLTCAGSLRIPQVLAPGAIEVLVYGEPDTVPSRYKDRRLVRHSPQITDLRLNSEEMAQVGTEVAKRLSHTQDRAYFMIPMRGFDSYAGEGGAFHDPEADLAFVHALKATLPGSIEVVEMDNNIEDPEFARICAEKLITLIRDKHAI